MKYKDWLNEWLEYYVKPTTKTRTYCKYRQVAQDRLLPSLVSGDGFVYECNNVSNAYKLVAYEGNAEAVVIPEGCMSIGENAFKDNTVVKNLTIPNSVTSIGDRAFAYCSSLTSIVIPDSVKSIGGGAFSGCSSLEKITIPFVGAKAGVTASDTYQYPFGYIFGTDSYTGGTATKQYYYGSSTSSSTYDTYYIPSSLRKVTLTGGNILRGAFSHCSSLTSIEIPDSVTSIGNGAFSGCSSLTSIEIPDTVTSIGDGAFYNCRSLEEITIPFVGRSETATGYQAVFGYIFGYTKSSSSSTISGATYQYYDSTSTSSYKNIE